MGGGLFSKCLTEGSNACRSPFLVLKMGGKEINVHVRLAGEGYQRGTLWRKILPEWGAAQGFLMLGHWLLPLKERVGQADSR